MSTPKTVLILNTNHDTVELLRFVLADAGFVVTSIFIDEVMRGEADLEPLVRTHPPAVVVYDVAIPYDRHWAYKQHLQTMPALRGVPFVLTTTNVKRLHEMVGAGDDVIEIVGKPYDLQQVVDAVKRGAGGTSQA